MKIGTIKKSQENPEDKAISLNGWKVFGGLTFTGLITGLVAAGTFWFISVPTNENTIELQNNLRTFELLNFALRNENDTIRNQSLNLLIDSELINDHDGKIRNLIDNNQIPDWSENNKFDE